MNVASAVSFVWDTKPDFPSGSAIKLEPVVRDKGSRDPESCNNVSPDEPFSIYVSNVSQWLSFDPFGEVICANQQISLISCFLGEGAYNIQSPLGERPWAGQRVKNPSWLMDIRGKSLALITFLNILQSFLLHSQPPISLGKGSMRQGSSSCMALTDPFVQLFKQ